MWHPIDYANPCPDFQVTSLHCHLPWLVKSCVRRAVYTAATKRRMRPTLDWEPSFAVAAKDLSYEEMLDAGEAIALERFEARQSEDFCAKHLGHLDEVAWEFFVTSASRDAVRQKVAALFPAHEVDQFTEVFG